MVRLTYAQRPPLTRNFMVLESCEAILALAPILEEFAARCEQPGAMHWLNYFLDPAVLGHRSPRLVLFLRPEEDADRSLASTDLRAAALFFEYKILGINTGIIATGDAVGFNSIIAAPGERTNAAAAASRVLLQRGALLVMSTYESAREVQSEPTLPTECRVQWATRSRPVRRILELGRTMDETLATMGKSTRFNLRYYRRRLEKSLACEFLPDAVPCLSGADLEALNASSLNPVSPDEFARRVSSASNLPGSFLCGLRSAQGQWLSLIGGWRQGTTTVLFWQMNTSGLEKHSLGTVMRSYFLESEIGRGAQKLLIFGGTPHSMRHAFSEDVVADLVVERAGLRARVARRVVRALLALRIIPAGNFVAETICDPELVWNVSSPLKVSSRALAVKGIPAGRTA